MKFPPYFLPRKWRESSVVLVVQQTLLSLFPFFLVLTLLLSLSDAVFSEASYLNTLFRLQDWFPWFDQMSYFLLACINLFVLLMVPLLIYFSIQASLFQLGQSLPAAGITGFIVGLILQSRTLFAPVNNNLVDMGVSRFFVPVYINLFFVIALGYGIAQLFVLVSRHKQGDQDSNLLLPISLSLLLGVLLNATFYVFNINEWWETLGDYLVTLLLDNHSLLGIYLNTLFKGLLAFFGQITPFNDLPLVSDPFATENLNAALKAHSTTHIPYLFTDTTLYWAYGNLAGLGGSLALVMVSLFFTTTKKQQKVSRWSLLPSFFNHSLAFMVSIPVFANPFLLLPFLLTPLINVGVASVFLAYRLVPPAVYPVPSGTPNLLYAFVGTGGSLRALFLTIGLFCLDCAFYWPFAKRYYALYDKRMKKGL